MRIAILIQAILMVNTINMKVEGAFPDAVPSHLICYSKENLEGEKFSVVSNVRSLVNDSGDGQDSNVTIRSCSVTGIWILYNLPGFQGKINAIYGEDSSFIPSFPGSISSIRKIESNHQISNELVLFQEPFFQNTSACNVFGEKEFPVVCPTIRSAIVKGFSDWTIVSEVSNPPAVRSASAISFCLKTNRNGAAFFGTLDGKTFVSVKSIKQGCKGRILKGEAQIKDGLEGKEDCGCNLNGVLNGDTTCNKDGECNCNFDQNFEGPKCDKCSYGYYMKNNVCEDCQCNPVASDGCDIYGDCKCIDPSFKGRKCNTKNIELKNLRPNINKILTVTCSGQCGTVSLQMKITNNQNGNLLVSANSGRFRCSGRFSNEKRCAGRVTTASFQIRLTKFGSQGSTILTITATNLLNVR